MNNGIKNKLKELIGKEVNVYNKDLGYEIKYPPYKGSYKILRVEEDCVVVGDEVCEKFISIDHISSITINKE